MSLNDSHMLPERVRNMRQMEDVLNAEDIILVEIVKIIDEIYQRASLFHEELINESWLESKLSERFKANASVSADAEQLLVTIMLDVSNSGILDIEGVREFCDKWLPAHLMYQVALQWKKKTGLSVSSAKETYISIKKGIEPVNKVVSRRAEMKVLNPIMHHITVSYGRKGD